MTVFDGFPFLEGHYLNYAEYFALLITILNLIISFFFLFLWLFCKYLENYFRRKDLMLKMYIHDDLNPNLNKVEIEDINQALAINRLKNELNYQTGENHELLDNEANNENLPGAETSIRVKVCFWGGYVSSLISLIFFSFVPICWSAFNLFPIPAAIFLMLPLYYIRFFYDIYSFCPQASKKRSISIFANFLRINQLSFRNMRIFYIVSNVLIIFFSIFLPFLFENTCISLFNPPIGISLSGYIDVSTKLTRSITENKKCSVGPPCHFYVTLPEDPSALFVNAHTNLEHENVEFRYDYASYYNTFKNFRYSAKPDRYKPVLEAIGERYVYSALIEDLDSDVEYMIGVFYDNFIQTSMKYKTFPKDTFKDEFVIISGGDVGSTQPAQEMTKNLSPLKPRAIFIGGDVAYDDGMTSCYHAWDSFLSMFEDLNKALGTLTPLILGVGNHDVGLNNLSGRSLDIDDLTPLFLQYFPQHYRRDKDGKKITGVPAIAERKTYFYHEFGNAVYLSLDSGYVADFRGEQREWINNTLTQFKNYSKFAQYHVPTYSSCINKDHDKTHNIDALLFWNPIFDKFNLLAAFENHVHLFKKTWKLKGNLKHPNGVLYLGDGLWGVHPNQCEIDIEEKIFSKVSTDYHVWVTRINETVVKHEALGLNGSIFDRDEQKIDDYKLHF